MPMPGLLIAYALLTSAALPPGKLDASHVALVFNKNSRASGELALYYADRRGVPKDRIIALDVPVVEELPRAQYQSGVVQPIRDWLTGRGLADQIVCLVMFYDVPIRVGAEPMTPERDAALARARRERTQAIKAYKQLLATVIQIAQPTTGPTTTTTSAPRPAHRAAGMQKQLRSALLRAMKRASRLRDPVANRATHRQLLACMEGSEGVSGILRHVRSTDRGNVHLGQTQLEKLRASIRQGQAEINTLLRAGPTAPEREEARRLIKRYAGLIGLLAHLEEDIKRLGGTDTVASVDSELSTMWAPEAGLYRWRMNTLNARHRVNPVLRKALQESEWDAPLMMVARLDGPTPVVVRRMIDDAVSTEKVGLRGHVYLDARGLKADGRPGSYGTYDQNLRELAALLRAKASLPTVIDNRKDLFGPAACPDTALYCGWYSVGRYQDAFTFVRGAVAFHIASNEAISLRDPKRRYWCKALLADGAAATLGPVHEPYLSAFPPPHDFFGLLLTGRYTLVECFYYTKPYNSWMMLLIGDPLYRPFALNPQLTVADVFGEDVLPLQPIPTSQPGKASHN